MASDNFKTALALVLVEEGGFADHPKDPGGRTLQGITQKTYDAHRLKTGKSQRIITRALQKDPEWTKERDAIYREQYWDRVRGNVLPAGLDYVVFDGAVNSGVSRSVKWLQAALGVRVDGIIGDITLARIKQAAPDDLEELIDRILARRLAFLKNLKTWPTFGRGWSARLNRVREAGKDLASGVPATTLPLSGDGGAKAMVETARSAPNVTVADLATGGAAGAGLLGGAVQTALAQLQPFSEIETIRNVVVWLTVASVFLTFGGILYRVYAARKTRELDDALDVREVSA